ncbi:MAG: hypothetical protein UR69_C0002G0212 [Candidatus Moranbacteria bacterium GW2011_GWE2_35_2-]|nr:MAG: hypothetical protein UR69_C0002G0212 [Candidatus Moranbacteria bacterium GW2011_GWE2_35_2-]KKQ22439.1 MAG: hypothetical protein US37_C0002G0064 [Candidatus Moranbacteria bacterium GW2011_GWF2_37_11]KKQ29508.1 MAG: hypothetical protein US44_C0001G0100 [Candidatus Moranbacteria bacterium GW2011_GWD1_37_17]KKQ30622.1 MAG: hypothetical protein US47_C0002G0212 [Candidatus Moranbacteria bacterium GW2011_GWE1_37_24]KKQ48154.1 MAG: hypothetical protein US66_C0001G0018 [Candidatus Moranbacteria 
MKRITAVVVSFLMAVVAIRYCYLIKLGEIHPVLATWLLFSLATGVGIWTYMRADSKKDVITNIANTTDVFATWSILLFLLFFGKDTRYAFSPFEILCIASVVAVLIYWRISKRANAANIAINFILVIGYLPTIVWLWKATENTESFSVWVIVLISNLTALYNPIKEKDWFALLYASRAVILVSAIIGLMVRIEFFR